MKLPIRLEDMEGDDVDLSPAFDNEPLALESVQDLLDEDEPDG